MAHSAVLDENRVSENGVRGSFVSSGEMTNHVLVGCWIDE